MSKSQLTDQKGQVDLNSNPEYQPQNNKQELIVENAHPQYFFV